MQPGSEQDLSCCQPFLRVQSDGEACAAGRDLWGAARRAELTRRAALHPSVHSFTHLLDSHEFPLRPIVRRKKTTQPDPTPKKLATQRPEIKPSNRRPEGTHQSERCQVPWVTEADLVWGLRVGFLEEVACESDVDK